MASVIPMLCGILLGFNLTKLFSTCDFSGAKDSGNNNNNNNDDDDDDDDDDDYHNNNNNNNVNTSASAVQRKTIYLDNNSNESCDRGFLLHKDVFLVDCLRYLYLHYQSVSTPH